MHSGNAINAIKPRDPAVLCSRLGLLSEQQQPPLMLPISPLCRKRVLAVLQELLCRPQTPASLVSLLTEKLLSLIPDDNRRIQMVYEHTNVHTHARTCVCVSTLEKLPR